MKTTETQKQQNVQTQKDQPIVRVQSNLRAGASASRVAAPCI